MASMEGTFGTGEQGQAVGPGDRVIDGRILRRGDRIYDLVDVCDDAPASETRPNHEIIVIDGRVYERVAKNGKPSDGARDALPPVDDPFLREEIMKRVGDVARQVAGEMFPAIAERILREEIDRLKHEDGAGTDGQPHPPA